MGTYKKDQEGTSQGLRVGGRQARQGQNWRWPSGLLTWQD